MSRLNYTFLICTLKFKSLLCVNNNKYIVTAPSVRNLFDLDG